MPDRRQFLYMAAAAASGLLLPAHRVFAGYDPMWKEGTLPKTPINISVFEMFKIGPGPSSSHTIAPMKAGVNFLEMMRLLPAADLKQADRIVVHLYGSLSDTGIGHSTHKAITAGLMGNSPENVPAELMDSLYDREDREYKVECPPLSLTFGMKDIVFEKEKVAAAYSDTMRFELLCGHRRILEREYYSVGGGFLEWKGWKMPDRGTPVHLFDSMNGVLACMAATGKTLPRIMLENEKAMTGAHPDDVRQGLLRFVEVMERSVVEGCTRTGLLKGPIRYEHRAKGMLKAAEKLNETDRFMARMSAYAHAAAEENSDGHPIVTAPTAGSAGVMPAVIHALTIERGISREALTDGMLAASLVGMLAKRHASTAGADVGCQGEIGVASAMSAALAAQVLDGDVQAVENAAELALEHHLGMTCDPVGGFVMIPCISRCAMSAVKAWNACVMARTAKDSFHPVGLDLAIRTMNATGRDMDPRYRETSKGGLALYYTKGC